MDQDDPILDLVEKIQAGIDREENFRKLYEIFRSKILSFFQRKGFSREDSRELTQEVFLRVFKGIDTFRRESRFERWLWEIAAHICLNDLRRRHTEKRDGQEQSLTPMESEEGAALELDLPAGEPSPEEGAIQEEQLQILREALRDLPPQMRRCCELRYGQGLKYQEIATVMGISIETVKAHLHQARKRLEAVLNGGPDPKGPGKKGS